MVSTKISLVVLLVIGVSSVLARPGAPSYPSEEENIIPDYAYDNEEDNGKSEHVGGWKSIPVGNPDKLYDEEVPETTPVAMETETSSISTTAASVDIPEEVKVAEAVGAVRAADVAASAGAAAAVHAVEVVKAAFETTDVPDGTTTTFAVESGRAAGSGTFEDEKPQGDAPTPTTDQSLYGFSKFLHDLLQVPVQVMRSVSTYLTSAFNSRHDAPGAPITPQDDHGLTSAMLSHSF